MKRLTLLAAVAAFACAAVLAPAFQAKPHVAKPKPKHHAVAAKAPTCPKCHMKLVAKKDAGHTAAVKIKGKTWFCCAACGAHPAH